MKKGIIVIVLISFLLGGILGCSNKKRDLLSSTERHNAEQWLEMADLLYRLRDYGMAADYYEKVVQNYPDTVYYDIADKKLKRAQKKYLRSIKK